MSDFKSNDNYKAFLSYSSSDEKLARWLWKRLDRYRTSKHLIGTEGKFGPIPETLHKIFRDRNELSSGNKLEDKIRVALTNSDSLIVLCTPASAKSKWVELEVKTFIELGRDDRIFPVIGSGEPNSYNPDKECFPPSLKGKNILAADLREIKTANGAIIGDGKINGKLKLIAGLLGVPLDSIIRRERRRQRRITFTLIISAILFAIVALAAIWMSLLANQNSKEATAQSNRNRSLLLANQSSELLGTDDQRSLLLAVEAVKSTAGQKYTTSAARSALLNAVNQIDGYGLPGHEDSVSVSTFNANDSLLATASVSPAVGAPNLVKIWRLSDNKPPLLKHAALSSGRIHSILFDKANHNIATFEYTRDGNFTGKLWFFDEATKYLEARPFLDGREFTAISTSDSYTNFAIALNKGPILLLSLNDFNSLDQIAILPHSATDRLVQLSFSQDETTLVGCAANSDVYIWDLSSPKKQIPSVFNAGHVAELPSSSDDLLPVDICGVDEKNGILYTASSRWIYQSNWADLDTKLWPLEENHSVGEPILLSHRGAPNSSAIKFASFFSSDGIVSVSRDGWLRAWNIISRVPKLVTSQTFNYRSNDFVDEVALSNDGSLLAFSIQNRVNIISTNQFNVETDNPDISFLSGFDGSIRTLRFSNTGRYLYAGGLGGASRVWDFNNLDLMGSVFSADSIYSRAEVSEIDESGTVVTILKQNSLEFWNITDPLLPTLMRKWPLTDTQFESIKECLSCTALLSPNLTWAAIQSTNENEAYIVELTTKGRSFTVQARVWKNTREIEFSYQGDYLFVDEGQGSETYYQLKLSAETIPLRKEFEIPHGSFFREVSNGGNRVLFRNFDGDEVNGYLFRLRDNLKPNRTEIRGFRNGIGNVSFSADDKWLAITSKKSFSHELNEDTRVRLFSLKNLKQDPIMLEGSEFTPFLSFSKDGRWLTAANGSVTLGDAITKVRLWTLPQIEVKLSPYILPSVETFLHGFKLSNDGRYLVTINGGGPTARLWKLDDGKPELHAILRIPRQSLNWNWNILFNKDSSVLVISNSDNPTPFLWRLDPHKVQPHDPILNGDRRIQSIDFSEDGQNLFIVNSGGTSGGLSGTKGTHATIVDLSTFPKEGSSFQVTLDENGDNYIRGALHLHKQDMILSYGRSVAVQKIDVETLLNEAKTAIQRNMNFEEWSQMNLREEYTPTFDDLPVSGSTLLSLMETSNGSEKKNTQNLSDKIVSWAIELDNPDHCNSIAWEFARVGDGERAVQVIECALVHFPDDPDYRDTRGVALAIIGRHREAIIDLEYYTEYFSGSAAKSASVKKRQRWIRHLRENKNPFLSEPL